ncbi:MAG TPA: hypothetical protein VFP08_02540 [Acidimicrobiales bacterium]|nr:hypothetical protein [Acidimicrobiales bacterium]
MKLKLGLLVGAGIGYLIGSGKASEMWNEIKERRPDQDRDIRTTVTVRSEQPVVTATGVSPTPTDLGDAAPTVSTGTSAMPVV